MAIPVKYTVACIHMKNPKIWFMSLIKIVSILMLIVFSGISYGQEWQIRSEETAISFSGTGADGTFSGLEGTIIFDPDNPEEANFNVLLDATSISTGNKTKDKHARGKNWFDVNNYPQVGFASSQVRSVGTSFELDGIIEIHGVKKEITIPFNFQTSEDVGTFTGSFVLDRNDFEIFGPFFGFVVGDEFKVALVISVSSS